MSIGILIGLGFILAVGFTSWAVWREWDRKKIYNFLKESKETTNYKFRSTAAIASATHLTEGRVEKLASRHPKIRRNSGERATWTLVE